MIGARGLTLCFGLFACTLVDPDCGADQPADTKPTPIQVDGLHNVFRVSPHIYSGSGPDDARAFEGLAALKIKTIISVDGAKPNIEASKKHGLRYVHIPIGYNGVPREQILQLAKAINECLGPFYIHCHHGKHRGPAAAAVALICADPQCTSADALRVMKNAGTDPRYMGLFDSVEKLDRPNKDEIQKAGPLTEVARVGAFTQAMVALDQHFDHLKLARTAGWKMPNDHPDIDPAREALQLFEHYQEMRRRPDIMKKPAEFQAFLREGESASRALEMALRGDQNKIDGKAAENAFARTAMNCNSCHAKFRD